MFATGPLGRQRAESAISVHEHFGRRSIWLTTPATEQEILTGLDRDAAMGVDRTFRTSRGAGRVDDHQGMLGGQFDCCEILATPGQWHRSTTGPDHFASARHGPAAGRSRPSCRRSVPFQRSLRRGPPSGVALADQPGHPGARRLLGAPCGEAVQLARKLPVAEAAAASVLAFPDNSIVVVCSSVKRRFPAHLSRGQ